MEICKHSQNIIFAPQNIKIDNVVLLTLTNNTQQLIITTQLHFWFTIFCVNSICIIWFLLRSLLYLFNSINCHYLFINWSGNKIWTVYFSAVLDNCSMPPNIVKEIVNDCNSRTIHFPIDHRNLNFHIVLLLSLIETFADIGINLLHIYAHTYSHSRTQTDSLYILTYTPFYLSHFQFEVVKSKKVWYTGNKSYCYALYHIIYSESSPIKCNIFRRQWKCILYLRK